MEYFAHPTAVVDEPARIGRGTKIWHFCHVMANAEIGEDCNLGQNVFVATGARIGRGCKIQNNVSLYEGVMLGDYVFCGPSCVFTNVKNPRGAVVRRGQYEPTVIEDHVTLGANCTVVCGARLGRYAFIAAGAVVTGEVAPYAMMAGVPARRIGWAGRAGYRLEPLADAPGRYRCPGTGEEYVQLDETTLRPADKINMPSNEDCGEPIPLQDLKAQYAGLKDEIAAALARVIESQGFILGPEVKAFEDEVAQYIGAEFAIGCASGSDALLLALMALDLPPGSEVISTPYTFFATAGAIARLGLRPVFCDIDPHTWNIDPERLAALITPRTRAILPVHLFGRVAPMEPMMALAEANGLAVIEDAAQAIGARDADGRGAGTIGAIGCFSFFPTKNLGGFGDGGLVTTNDPELAKRLRSLRTHGSTNRYFHDLVGINSRLDALQAAVLRVKLPRLDGWSDARAANANIYRRLFAEAGLTQPAAQPDAPGKVALPESGVERHIYNQFVITVHETQRDPLREHLQGAGIGTAIYYPLPLHLQPCFRELGYKEGDLPHSERASRQTLALPIYPELTEAQQRRVVNEIGRFMAGCGKP